MFWDCYLALTLQLPVVYIYDIIYIYMYIYMYIFPDFDIIVPADGLAPTIFKSAFIEMSLAIDCLEYTFICQKISFKMAN